MMMASRWTELVEIDHSIREDGGLCKMWSQTASFSCKKLNLNLFSTSVLRNAVLGAHLLYTGVLYKAMYVLIHQFWPFERQ